MGRRALPKIAKELDLSHNLRMADDLPNPWSNAAVFGREAPLEIEIGTGKGLFLQRAAGVLTEHNFLGIEIARKYARFAASRLAKRELENAVVVSGDATKLFAELFPPACAAAVHVYFPDPWWKKRHHKRRVMNPTLLRHIEKVLQPEGRLHFWTDVQEYYDASVELIPQVTKLAGPFPVEETPAEDSLDYRTHFERRTRMAGLPVFRCEFEKQ